jgi:tRNA (cytidine56-2'-O)-methyltransferase
VALVARAFDAQEILIDTKSTELEDTIHDVNQRFGGTFIIKTGIKWRKIVQQWTGTIVHLTMYGTDYQDVIPKIKKTKNILILVGSRKVPGDFYHYADYNIAIGHEPHSEVAALAIFLHQLKRKI